MKLIAINGSPRKKWNTATLLQQTLDGAASQGFETELFHLYDLNFKGCISCFSCKVKNGKNYGRCAFQDDLTPVLEKIAAADALVLGSPIYYGWVSGEIKSFLERLMFPYTVYDANMSSLFKRKMPTAFIYTMEVNEERMKRVGFDRPAAGHEQILAKIFKETSLSLLVNETYQFDDYSKYVSDRFNPEERAERRKNEFPKDCRKAFDIGIRLVEIAKNEKQQQ